MFEGESNSGFSSGARGRIELCLRCVHSSITAGSHKSVTLSKATCVTHETPTLKHMGVDESLQALQREDEMCDTYILLRRASADTGTVHFYSDFASKSATNCCTRGVMSQ